MSDKETGFPNLAALVGRTVAILLVQSAGSLPALCSLNDAGIRQLGGKTVAGCSDAVNIPMQAALGVSAQLLSLTKQAQFGFLMFATVLRDSFQLNHEDVLTLVNLNALKKAMGVLSRKALLAARTDQGGGSSNGSEGESMAAELSTQFTALATKTAEEHIQALPVPEFFEKHEDGRIKKRGGKKTQQVQQQIAKRKGLLLSDSEAARLAIASEVRYASAEVQEERLQGREMKAIELAEQAKRMASRKRARDEEESRLKDLGAAAAPISGGGEFDDLFGATL
ncbi:GPI-anchored surface protein, putative [Bodo saltans]|uniref:GPI-anchored surface protein, putative n=1 Tax=Bodo saltans TaxID=75058 RepID=A0A0S4JJR8_BODSA|nr:GPI-anchored surface protein, putative [Bodo saltans]|eukprot:CUG91703.1 GPI-anchored surface protein, putative [Bodo saltans]